MSFKTGCIYKHKRPGEDTSPVYVLVLGQEADEVWWILSDTGEVKKWPLIEGCRRLIV